MRSFSGEEWVILPSYGDSPMAGEMAARLSIAKRDHSVASSEVSLAL
jgi:hypothetical protein